MGRMRIGNGPVKNEQLERNDLAIKVEQELPVFENVSKCQFDKAMSDVMEKHADTFKRLAEAEEREKRAPLATMLSSPCVCPPMPKMVDSWSRKHTVKLRVELLADRKELEDLLVMYAQSTDKKIKELQINDVRQDETIDLLTMEIPQEKQVVIPKPETDIKVWIAIAISIALNIAFILIK